MIVPITVLTGFLGAGKTTIVISLLKQLKEKYPTYNVVMLKNEFGDVQVDSELVKSTSSNINVQEMLNGCMCCVLVGQMENALLEIKTKYNPDRIIIETSGSAFPAPIAWKIRDLSEHFKLDAILTVIDCVNFTGYEDKSYTAKLQAQYTDLILLNKHELMDERSLDLVLDHVYELNTDTPKIKCNGKNGVALELMIGIDSKLFIERNDEIPIDEHHHDREVDIIQISLANGDIFNDSSDTELFKNWLKSMSKESIYRVKGFVKLDKGNFIVNHAFGRSEFIEMTNSCDSSLNLTVMGVSLAIFVEPWKNILSQETHFTLYEADTDH